jgi:hypothetical protein
MGSGHTLELLGRRGTPFLVLQAILEIRPDALVISGDTAEAPSVTSVLLEIQRFIKLPVYFVLGNHDFYGGSIASVRCEVSRVTRDTEGLNYLPEVGVVSLSSRAALIGHDGWADGRYGDYIRSAVMLNDYVHIQEFKSLDKLSRVGLMQQLAGAAAAQIANMLRQACETHERILVATHVPPFAEACRFQGRPTDPAWLPHFSSKVLGGLLLAASARWAQCSFDVLCGHTHERVDVRVRPNLRVRTAGAQYGRPDLAAVIDLD